MNGIECAFFARVGSVTPIKTSQSGKARCAAKVAIGSDDATQWVRVALFNGLAEQLAPTLAKGDRVYIEGNLKLDRWQSRGPGAQRIKRRGMEGREGRRERDRPQPIFKA